MSKFAAIGDSITEGYPYSQEESWVEQSARELGFEFHNFGVCGELTADILYRFPRDVLPVDPTHVIVMGGTNDAVAHVPLESVVSNFKDMASLCHSNDISCIFALPVPSTFPTEEALLDEYREWMKFYAAQKNIPVLDFYTPFNQALKHDKTLLVDGVHPSRAGYELMTRTAVEFFTSQGLSSLPYHP